MTELIYALAAIGATVALLALALGRSDQEPPSPGAVDALIRRRELPRAARMVQQLQGNSSEAARAFVEERARQLSRSLPQATEPPRSLDPKKPPLAD